MSRIKVISNLILNSNGVQTKYKNGKPHDFFIRQGDIDGACAPYSVCMILMILGILKRRDLDVYNRPDYRTSKGKLLRAFFDQKGLVRDGYHYDQLLNELNVLKTQLSCTLIKKKDEVLAQIKEQIENDMPILISVDFVEGGHALVAVALEYDVNEVVSKIFCIDPGFDKPKLTYWNSVIDIEKEYKGKFPCTWINDNKPIEISEAISFELI